MTALELYEMRESERPAKVKVGRNRQELKLIDVVDKPGGLIGLVVQFGDTPADRTTYIVQPDREV